MKWEDVRDWINEKFQNKSPQNVINYVDNNVTDLASAKTLLKMLSLVIYFILVNKNWVLGDTGGNIEEE